MDITQDSVKRIMDFFDIQYEDAEAQDKESNEISSTAKVKENFEELQKEMSDTIMDLKEKGCALEFNSQKEDNSQVEEKNETKTKAGSASIDDILANSVSEAQQKLEQNELLESNITTEADNCKSVKDESKNFDDMFLDEIVIQKEVKEKLTTSAPIETHEDVEEEEEEVVEEAIREKNVLIEPNVDKVDNCFLAGEIVGDDTLWQTQSPSPTFDIFYALKKQKIEIFSGGKQLDFDRYYKELENSSVDISTEVLDPAILIDKMDQVMKSVERLSAIQLKINHQYFVWKRFVVLLRGCLAKVQCLKPVAKQEGLILEHMGDIECYVERLTALYKSADNCMKTLDKAYDSLSRKVTIMLSVQNKHIDRQQSEFYPVKDSNYRFREQDEDDIENEREDNDDLIDFNNDLSDYDNVQIGQVVLTKNKTNGEVDWGEIF